MNAALARQVMRFVDLNREALFDYWYERLTTEELSARLQRIED
jgi:hypothetical protein